jgi:hypothetical protein
MNSCARALSLVVVLMASAAVDLTAAQERFTISGVVRDRASGDTLAAANIRVLGTSFGTITNAQGRYVLHLHSGPQALVFTSLGYSADTLRVALVADTTASVSLQPSDIILPEILITSEDPAVGIIRRAIENKKRWMDALRTYSLEAFTRQTILRDTAIASITESYTTGFWQKGDTLREVVTQRRETANLKQSGNVASVGRILNFLEDRIRFAGFDFVGPTAEDALDYYGYKLIRTRRVGEQDVYEIAMSPRARTVPLFRGTVNIADGTFALAGVDVEPNEAFQIPLVKSIHLRYRQQFALYDEFYWMPMDIRIDGSFTIGLIGFSFPKLAISQTSVIYKYSINTPVPDSVFRKPRLVVDSTAARYDSTFWADTPVLPLDAREREAYATLDSTQRLEVQFRPGGMTATLASDSSGWSKALEYLDLSFNRVEGFRVGGKFDVDQILPFLGVRGGFAYGCSDKQSKYFGGVTLYPWKNRIVGFGGDMYRQLEHRPDQGYYGPLVNSCTALLAKNDYRDYYRADGWKAFVVAHPSAVVSAELSFIAARQTTVVQNTDFSFFFPSRTYRANPPVTEGMLRTFRLDARLGPEPVPLDFIVQDALDLAIEAPMPSIVATDFDYRRYWVAGTVSVPTFGRSLLFKPTLRIRAAAGTSSGTLPPQRLFDLESSSSGLGPFGVLRGVGVKEFTGTEYVVFTLEHTFRSVPFLALNIPWLYENGVEFLIHGGLARTWNRGALPIRTTDGWYAEAGFGFSRIFDLLRVDFTWRLDGSDKFVITIANASFF